MRPERVDGNALAGLLAEVFDGDETMLVAVCACGAAAAMATTVVELDDAVAIVRCRTCTHTLLTVRRDADGVSIALGELRELVRR